MSKSQEKKKKKSQEDLKKEYEYQGRLASIENRKAALKLQEKELSEVLDPELNPDSATKGKEKPEWEELRKYIMIHFPEAKEHINLGANKIMVGIALAQGWSVSKIAAASGLNNRTIYDWKGLAEVEYLINEFRIREGLKDPKDLVTENGYIALKQLNKIIREPVDKNNTAFTNTQASLLKFAAEMMLGKAAETVNVNKVTYKEVAEMVYEQSKEEDELTEDEKDALFH